MQVDTMKKIAAIVGMVLVGTVASFQLHGLIAAETGLSSSSGTLLVMIVVAGLIDLATWLFTARLVLKTVRP